MYYGSVCSGVEAATLAWEGLGWQAKFYAEVEPFPSAVLCHRYGATRPIRPLDPAEAINDQDRKTRESWIRQISELPVVGKIPNLGDFTKIRTEDYDGQIDLLVGGTPCTSFSIAGLRKGLEDARGQLMLEFVKLAYRTGARWINWENVPGALSSGGGEDFASFLSLLCGWELSVPERGWKKCGIVTPAPGCFGVAWRILDAQYTRVSSFPRAIPQRRRRIFLVGYLGNWEYPAKVLFDGEMCGGDSPPRRTKRQRIAADFEGGIDPAGTAKLSNSADVLPTLDAHYPAKINNQDIGKLLVEDATFWNGKDVAETLTCTGNNQFMPDKSRLQCVIDMRQIEVHAEDVSPTLIATDYKGGKAVSFYTQRKAESVNMTEECSTTLINGTAPGHQNAVCFEHNPTDSRLKEVGVSPTVLGRWGTGGNQTPIVVDSDYYSAASVPNGCDAAQRNDGEPSGHDAAEVLLSKQMVFSFDSLSSNSMKSANPNSGCHQVEVSKTLDTTIPEPSKNQGGVAIVEHEPEMLAFIKNDAGSFQDGYWEDVFPTIRSQVTPAIARQECFNVTFCDANGTRKDRPDGGLYVTEAETSKTITTAGTNAETIIIDPLETPIALDGDKMAKAERKGGSGLGINEDGVMYTQTAKDVHAVAYSECVPLDLRNATRDPGKCDAVNRQGVGVGNDGDPMTTISASIVPGVGYHATVRRLLPVECERLMGFPDNYTLIPWKGKPAEECPDAPRYKACGNSMCVNAMMWIGERIQMVENNIQGLIQ